MKKFILALTFIALLLPQNTFSQSPTPVQYELPYPGILPGNPLYPLKALRDKIIELATADPIKKGEFYLLQADKRLSAALLLYEMGEKEKSEQTISKGLNYLERSIGMIDQAKRERGEVGQIAEKIKVSTEKQKEQINILIEKSDGELKQKLEQNLKRVEGLLKSAEELSPKQ